MPVKQQPPVLKLGAYAGAVVAILGVWLFGIKAATQYVDNRIECKTEMIYYLLQEIATPEQRLKAQQNYNLRHQRYGD